MFEIAVARSLVGNGWVVLIVRMHTIIMTKPLPTKAQAEALADKLRQAQQEG